MIRQAKPLASLSSGLLARKGQARPAMRPQGFAGTANPAPSLDDLGWNDMGQDALPAGNDAPMTAPVVPLPVAAAPLAADPVVAIEPPVAEVPVAELPVAELPVAEVPGDPPAPERPAVLVERDALAEELEAPRAVKSVSVATATRLRRETAHVGRAAFTLRLDAERHLRLRLASAVSHRSAQQLVQHALDQFLQTIPEVETLFEQLPATSPRPRPTKRQQRS